MSWDLSQTMMQTTVKVEGSLPDGRYSIGTGFLVNDPTPDGRPRTVLVTANHVLAHIVGAEAHIGYRTQGKDGGWRYDPEPITIRDGTAELWRHNAAHDVAVIEVKAPAAFAKAAIPLNWLASGDTFSKYDIGPGDEMMVLGYPQGLSANKAGFPILRSGRVASPVETASADPTFLLDFRVFPGNSGGPVFISDAQHRRPGASEAHEVQFIAGILTQQVEQNNERLEIGIVTEAEFVREALSLLDQPRPAEPAQPAAPTPAAATVASTSVNKEVSATVGRRVED